jgi:hypothetical protein
MSSAGTRSRRGLHSRPPLRGPTEGDLGDCRLNDADRPVTDHASCRQDRRAATVRLGGRRRRRLRPHPNRRAHMKKVVALLATCPASPARDHRDADTTRRRAGRRHDRLARSRSRRRYRVTVQDSPATNFLARPGGTSRRVSSTGTRTFRVKLQSGKTYRCLRPARRRCEARSRFLAGGDGPAASREVGDLAV